MNKPTPWPLTLYYDGDCPLCAREIALLRRRAPAEQLQLVDISSGTFDAATLGLSHQAMQVRLHARFADGRWVTGLDATLWSWRAAGLGRWAAPLNSRPLRPLLEVVYRLFCTLRPHLEWLPHPDASRRCRSNSCSTAPNRNQSK